MSKEPRKELKDLLDAKGPNEAAAATLASASPAGDPPSEADVDLDYDFLNYDPTDPTPHLRRCGVPEPEIKTRAASFRYRWCNTDHRLFDKRTWEGWVPVQTPTGTIKRGDTILCQMPLARAEKMDARIAERTALRADAAMRRYEQEVSRYTKSGDFSTFDDPSGPRLK